MADTQELVFCHQCQNEWHRNEHGLQCPECHSEFVEVIEADHDSRNTALGNENDSTNDFNPDRLPHNPTPPLNPFHNHNPWVHAHDHIHTQDHTDGGVSHSEWNPAPGVHFSRTSYRSTSPNARTGPGVNDPFAPFFQSFSAILNGPGGFNRPPGAHQHYHTHGSAPTSPLREGPPRLGFTTAPHRMPGSFPPLTPRDANNPQPNGAPVDNLQGLLGTLVRGIQEMHGNTGGHGGHPPLQFFSHFLNPANAQHGDAVYTEEALDRIITQIMEAQNGQGAPGPATKEAIKALPKKKADESILGPEGKAECSVCMDNVTLGDEVTVLPCSHWFHGECVGAWLNEHDTCPHCRQGIMAKDDGDQPNAANGPRQPGQEPRHSQPPLSTPNGNNGFHFAWQSGSQPGSPSSPNLQPPGAWSRHEGRSRRRSSTRDSRASRASSGSGGGGGGNSGITGWVRQRFGGGSNSG